MRVLFLTHRLPYAPNRGDRLRAYHILQWLHDRAAVELVSLVHDDEEAGHVDEVRAFVSRRHHAASACDSKSSAGDCDPGHGVAAHSYVARCAWHRGRAHGDRQRPPARRRVCVWLRHGTVCVGRRPCPSIPLILDLVDVDSRKWLDLAATARAPLSWIYKREARTLGAFEARAATSAAATLVVNEREAEIARQLAPDANVHVVANGVELERLRPPAEPSEQNRVVFCGVMNYAPNDQGMRWFINEVWPIVRTHRSGATLAVVGADPGRSLQTLCARDHTIELTGRVPDVRPWLWESAVAIAPLHVARGVQNKALEAIACGLPIVITSAVAAGLPRGLEPALTVADTAPQFARSVIELLELPAATRRARAVAADLGELKWSRTLQPLEPLLRDAARGKGNGK